MTITTYTDREIALRQQLAAALQLAQLNGEIAAELKADKLALEAAIDASRKQQAVAWLITAAGTKRQEVQLCKPYRLLTSERVRPLYAAPVVAPDVKHANLLKVMKDIVQLWDHHCYEHGDGIPSPLHCRAKEAIAAMGGAND